MRGKAIVLLASAICLPVVLTGCKTTESAFDNDCKVGGTAVGAIIGGVAAGMLLGKGNGRIGTALLGAAVGGFVGNQLGGLLDCQDKQAVDSASQVASDAPVGQKVVWASDTASVPPTVATAPAPVPVPASKPAATTVPTATPTPSTTSSNAKSSPQKAPQSPGKPRAQEETKAVSPPPPVVPQQKGEQWAAVEPIRSGGQSGMWGWVEPVSAPTTASDGRVCRTLKQVVVERSGAQHEENVTSCINEQKQWVVASR